jgi:exodeoxyribonuclease V alpha subunit
MTSSPLTPRGTARERFLRAHPGAIPAGPSPAPRFPEELLRAVQSRDDGPEMLFIAWEILRCAEGLDADTERSVLLLALASLIASRYGSTRVPLLGPEGDEFLTRSLTELGVPAPDPVKIRRLINDAVLRQAGEAGRILGPPEGFTPLVTNGEWLAPRRLLHYEQRLVDALRQRLAAPIRPTKQSEKAILAFLRKKRPIVGGQEITLSAGQERAVLTALKSSLTIITGGPGTGKTSVVVSILRALVREEVPMTAVALAAPTGKAANRMQEAIGKYLHGIDDLADLGLLKSAPPGRTLHRLLGYSPETDRFLHHENNLLSEDVVIVDESSMIDLFLMDRLVRAVKPEARLILLGDSDQLPSVEAGAVFRDMARAAHACQLRENFRMSPKNPAGRNILAVAQALNSGSTTELFAPGDGDASLTRRAQAADVAFEKVELLEPSLHDAFLERWWTERVRPPPELDPLLERKYRYVLGSFDKSDSRDLGRLSTHLESSRILCLTRGSWPRTGAEAVNQVLHRRVVESWQARSPLRGSTEFLPGEPVLVQRNDYQRGVFNGDQGLIVRVQFDGSATAHLAAVFPQSTGFVAFPLDGLRPILSHAYATTVHKAQGSEFESVALLLPQEDSPLLTREILYTAVSRSRRSVVIVGARELIERGAARKIERFSGVAEGIAGAMR